MAFACSCAGTLLLRRWLLARAMLDHPNERSSHAVAVPRGGGAVFVALSAAWLVIGIAGAEWAGAPGVPGALAAAAAGILVGAVGWVDDARGVRPAVRLAVHLAAAALVVVATVGVPGADAPDRAAPAMANSPDWVAWGALALLVVATAWMVNLVNFMDGIDGIAGMEGVFVLGGAGVVSWFAESPDAAAALALAPLAAAVAGFLVVNLSPHRVFMGDAGSGALGLLVAWALVACVAGGALTAWSALILPAAFVADATTTLAVRLLRGEHPARPHRTHAYQRLVRLGASHRAVTAAYALVNGVIVLPAALLAEMRPAWGAGFAGGVYVALVAAALAAGAGREPAANASAAPGRA
jgi:Fuc2NAc and GlcNAc transferase